MSNFMTPKGKTGLSLCLLTYIFDPTLTADGKRIQTRREDGRRKNNCGNRRSEALIAGGEREGVGSRDQLKQRMSNELLLSSGLHIQFPPHRYQCAGHDGEGTALCVRPTIWHHKKNAGNREAPQNVHQVQQTQDTLNRTCQDWLVGFALTAIFVRSRANTWNISLLKFKEEGFEIHKTHYEMHPISNLFMN